MTRRRGMALKLTLLLILVGVVPMAMLGFVAYGIARDSMTETTTEFFVRRVAEDTAETLDLVTSTIREETRLLAYSNTLRENVNDLLGSTPGEEVHAIAEERIRADLNHWGEVLGNVDLLVVATLDGRILVTNSQARPALTGTFAGGEPGLVRDLFDDPSSNPFAGESLADRSWWPATREYEVIFIDSHREPLVMDRYAYPPFLDQDTDQIARDRVKNPESYSFAFASRIGEPSRRADATGATPPQAMLIAFHNWSYIQDVLDRTNESFSDHERYDTAYTFLFAADLNTIIGHYYKRLYDGQLVEDHGLRGFRQAMLDAKGSSGTHRYVYRKEKISGFAPVATTGWQVGFGINEEDFNGPVTRLRNLIIGWSLGVTALITALVAWIMPRFTRPIRSLIAQAREISRGNLDARVRIETGDEIEQLGETFNEMAEDLKESNKKLIEAEKQAAWQEMARQVAHEIKNPLTPIRLSAQLIERAHDDQHPEFENILRDGVRNIVGQTESLRRIASDFSDFASLPKRNLEPQRILSLVEEVVQLYRNEEATGVEVGIEALAGADVSVLVDADEMKRVFINLFNNALEAMPEGGRLTVSLLTLEGEDDAPRVDIRVKDTGTGIAPELVNRLFEPYFTTRTSGTGLGLAIAKKTVDGYGGTIDLNSAPGEGTSVNITLPVHL